MMAPSDSLGNQTPRSGRHRSSGAGGSGGGLARSSSSGCIIRPSPVTEKSFIESVAGFINEVQTSPVGMDSKVQVTWARFEVADINDTKLYPEGAEINGNSPPLVLVLGYTSGVQVWLIPVTGEAQEVLSWKQGSVKSLRILPTPEPCFGTLDNFAHCRPLIAMVDSTGPGTPFSSASFISLKSGEQVHNIKFNSEIADIMVNRRVVVTTFKEKLAVFDACTLEARFTITSCYPSPGVIGNPISLGDRWLAYADKKLVPIHRSFGGLETDSSQSMAAWGINVGSKLASGVSKIYSNFFSSSYSPSSQSARGMHPPKGDSTTVSGEAQKGVITVLDLMKVYKTERDEVNISDKIEGIVAHFIAHNKAIVALQFDHSGSLLLTCDRLGNYFNIFRIVPHPAGSCFSAVWHLYSLYRGDTPGSVQDIAFSPDSRWVTVSTLRGTTHIFPITPYGGQVGVRTHTSSRVVNRLSRFHRSAGIDETKTSTSSSSGRNSPNPNLAGTSPIATSYLSRPTEMGGYGSSSSSGPPLVLAFPNPHMPPFPSPTLVQPVAQLRQPYIVTLTNQTIGSASAVSRKKSFSGSAPSADDVPVRLAACFAPSRAWLVGAQHNMFNRNHRKAHNSLFVVANHGVLLEYTLDVIPDSTLPKEKICESSPIELVVTAYGQWNMTPPKDRAELQPPLPIDSPLMLMSPADYDKFHGLPNQYLGRKVSGSDDGSITEEEKWLSQVEIITHLGPHRRLWMGPQFCFKTLQPAEDGEGNKVVDLDISLPSRPDQSNPVNMPSALRHPGHDKQGKIPVLIEVGSASSFEFSPRFSNAFAKPPYQAKQDTQDVEKELEDAMSEAMLGEESILDGRRGTTTKVPAATGKKPIQPESSEEEFFCLTPEDSRSIGSARSRNASSTSQQSLKQPVSTPVQLSFPDTKIFSVAVEARRGDQTKIDSMKICDIDTDFSGRFAVVSSEKQRQQEQGKGKNGEIKEETRGDTGKKEESSSKSSGKKKSKKNKNEDKKVDFKSAELREVTPLNSEDVSELETKYPEKHKALKSSSSGVDLLTKENVKYNETSVEVMKPSKIKKNKCESEFHVNEDFDVCLDDKSSSFDLNSSAKPAADQWSENFLRSHSSDAVLKVIEDAGKLWEDEKPKADEKGSTEYQLDLLGSSDDDLEFKPVRKSKKSSRKSTSSTSSGDDSDFKPTDTKEGKLEKEGWSFEADDLDINRMISETCNTEKEAYGKNDEGYTEMKAFEEEKTPLEDVFKFDSELSVNDDDPDFPPLRGLGKAPRKKTLSLDDLNDALEESAGSNDDTGCDKSGESVSSSTSLSNRKMSTSLNVTFNEDNLISNSAAKESLASIGSTSESSVGNSPNPKKNTKKKRKKNKK